MRNFARASCRFFTAAIFAMMIGFLFVEAASAADTPPEAPSEIWFHARSKTELQISWKFSEGATSYEIYQDQAGSWQPLKEISETLAISNAQEAGISDELRLIKIPNLKCGTSLKLIVGARNVNGESGPSPVLENFTDPCGPLLPPILISPADGISITSNVEITLSWANGSEDPVDFYWFELRKEESVYSAGFTDITHIKFADLRPGDYAWKSQVERDGQKSEWSVERHFHVSYYEDPSLTPPLLIYPVDDSVITDTSWADFDWLVSSENAVGSWFELSGEGDFLRTAFVTDTRKTEGGLLPGNYEWRVSYVTDSSSSPWSESFHFQVTETPTEAVLPPVITKPVSGTVVVTEEVLSLQWTNMSVDGYNIEVEGPRDFLQTGFLTTTSTTLQFEFPGYYFAKVQSMKGGILSEWSEKVLIFVDAPTEPVVNCGTWAESDVILFTDINCAGSGKAIPLGTTLLRDIHLSNRVVSIFIPPGLSVRIRELAVNGTRIKCYGQSMWNLPEDTWFGENKLIGSNFEEVTVFPTTDCTNPRIATLIPSLHK